MNTFIGSHRIIHRVYTSYCKPMNGWELMTFCKSNYNTINIPFFLFRYSITRWRLRGLLCQSIDHRKERKKIQQETVRGAYFWKNYVLFNSFEFIVYHSHIGKDKLQFNAVGILMINVIYSWNKRWTLFKQMFILFVHRHQIS